MKMVEENWKAQFSNRKNIYPGTWEEKPKEE